MGEGEETPYYICLEERSRDSVTKWLQSRYGESIYQVLSYWLLGLWLPALETESINVCYWSCDVCVYAMVDCIDKFIHIVTKHNLNIKRYSLLVLPHLWKAPCLMFIKQPFFNIILNIPILPSKSLCLFYKQERKPKPSKDIYEKYWLF